VSTVEMGVQTMNNQSGNKAMPVKDNQKKPNPTEDQLDEQELNKVTGGTSPSPPEGGWNRVKN
jgi:bacteriocin-like protein